MSETTESPAAPVEEAAPVEATDQTPAPVETTQDAAEPTPDPEPAPKPDKVERRIANLTRKMGDETRAREAAERELAAARELLAAKTGDAAPTSTAPTDVEARAAQMVAEREFQGRLTEIDRNGKKELGPDLWEQAKATMTSLGATSNQAFLQALADSENPARLFAHFADDTDALVELLDKSPAAIGRRIGKLDEQLTKPAARPLSAAPKPAPRVTGSATPPAPTPYNYPSDMSMKEFNAMMDNFLPKSLGGKKSRD